MKSEQTGAVAGMVGTVISCSAMMFSLFPALLGTVGASASMAGMGVMGGAPVLPAWVDFVTRYSAVILAVSIILMVWAVRRASRLVQGLVGVGILLLIINEISMTPVVFLPALALIIGGNALGWRQSRTQPRSA